MDHIMAMSDALRTVSTDDLENLVSHMRNLPIVTVPTAALIAQIDQELVERDLDLLALQDLMER